MQTYWTKRALVVAATLLLSACGTTRVAQSPATTIPGNDGASEKALSVYDFVQKAERDYGDIEKTLSQSVSANPEDVQAYLRLAVFYRHVGDYEQARAVLEQALPIAPTPAVVQNEQAIVYRTEGQFQKARDVYLGILQTTPEFHDAHVNLGILYDLYLREPELAHNHYQMYLNAVSEHDQQVEKWMVDLQRRHGIGANASVVKIDE